jgi:hypothetical protein
MKRCRKCGETKSDEDFYRKLTGRQSSCKACAKADGAARYATNKSRVVERNAIRRKRLASEVDMLKSDPCVDCGKQYEPICMDFDHRDGETKIDAVARLVHNHWSMRRIEEEIAKCDLVCVLCHKTRTHRRHQERRDKKPLGKTQIRNIAILEVAKAQPCAVCGLHRQPWQMEFDHLDVGAKRDNVTTLAWSRSAASVIEDEVAKCRVLCSLCHRRETAKNEGWRSKSKGVPFTRRTKKPGKRTAITTGEVQRMRERVQAGVRFRKAHQEVCPHVKQGTAYAACYRGFPEAGPIPPHRWSQTRT